jgi:hypothetical protein
MAGLRLIPTLGAPIELSRAETVVGREPGCDLVLSDGSVSRKHATIERRGQLWAVVDQGSANGTYVDSQKVGEAVLKNGQELRFGTVAFRVEIPDDLEVTVAGSLPDATVMAASSGPPPKPAGPPPLPRAASAPRPPAPPSAAAARERFRGASGSPSSAPVPQMSSPPPPKKGRGPVFWMFAGCCGCLLLVALFAAVLGGGAFFLTRGAAEAAKATLREIKQGDLDTAYASLATSYKAEMSREQFADLVASHPGLRDNADSTFWSRSVTNDRGTLSGVLAPTSGRPEKVRIDLVRENGTWKISGIHFEESQEGLLAWPERALAPA